MGHGWHPTPRFWDRVARIVITGGGVGLILAVLAILLFIVREAAPLAGRATVSEGRVASHGIHGLTSGTDEYRELGFVVSANGIHFHRLDDGSAVDDLASPIDTTTTCAVFEPKSELLALGSADGRAALASVDFEVRWEGTERVIVPRVRTRGMARLDTSGVALSRVVGDRDADGGVALAGIDDTGELLYAWIDAEGDPPAPEALAVALEGRIPTALALSLDAAVLAVGTSDGTLYFWSLKNPAAPELEDHVNAAESRIGALQLLLGDQSLVVGSDDGALSVWFRMRYARVQNGGRRPIEVDGVEIGPRASHVFPDRNLGARYAHLADVKVETAGQPWTRIRTFESHDAPITYICAAPRGKTFASFDASGVMALHNATSHRTLAVVETHLDHVASLAFSPRADALVAVAGDGIHVWGVDDPHPEASVRALVGKVWYEGYSEPEHVWQSTGGSEEFESKLGLVPLFVGTLKGTLYAMLFSIPLSILGALYLSQLATPGLRNSFKPVVELMAAVPSVVVGFLGALWLAPVLEQHLTAVFSAALLLPAGLALAIGAWMLVPDGWRQTAMPGTELLFMLPFLGAALLAGASLAAPIEHWFFAGDLKQWLFDSHGVNYDQRNCVVVGIALGFAVIPIIFSICEDAMSSVPRSLTTAALALGASRWQTAFHVILPAASPGIFAAVMLGLGRAIGETMIVLMATGNTPIMDLSPFNGMRTMSAAIAVEIPEAPHAGTLYRVLFLTGTLLFLFTFLINTGADLIGRKLRKRYAQF